MQQKLRFLGKIDGKTRQDEIRNGVFGTQLGIKVIEDTIKE